MTPQMVLFGSGILFVATHLSLSHPLREPLVRRMGEKGFRGLYSLIALVLFAGMLWSYRAIGREVPIWQLPGWAWTAASIVMWLAAALFVGSFVGNPALPGSPGPRGGPRGVLAITRHPMMWSFALWAIVHMAAVATVKSLVLGIPILGLALVGSALQDRKKAALMGETWHEWTAQTAFVPFTRGLANPGAVALVGGTLLWLVATWLHPASVGPWAWTG